MKPRSTQILAGLVILVLHADGLPGFAATNDQRIWTSLASVEMTTKARNIDKGTPMGFPNGPDSPVEKNYQIPCEGLLRVTVWTDPYYGGAVRNLNTGGAGVGPMEIFEIHRLTKPKDPVDGVAYMRTAISSVAACKSAFVKIEPPVAASGWSQLGCSIKALVEFSPGKARPGENFGPPQDTRQGSPQTPKISSKADARGVGATGGSTTAERPVSTKPTADRTKASGTTGLSEKASASAQTFLNSIAGSWKIDANGYGGAIKIDISTGNNIVVKMFYDVTGKWETMTNATYSAENRELKFTRPWTGNPQFQQYRGKLVDGRLNGTFTDTNTPNQQFPWSGRKF